MNWKLLLEHYKEDMADENLLEAAIMSMENYFELMDKNELMHHSRIYAIAYLALVNAKEKTAMNTDAATRSAIEDDQEKNDSEMPTLEDYRDILLGKKWNVKYTHGVKAVVNNCLMISNDYCLKVMDKFGSLCFSGNHDDLLISEDKSLKSNVHYISPNIIEKNIHIDIFTDYDSTQGE